jgi:hypothetical protein
MQCDSLVFIFKSLIPLIFVFGVYRNVTISSASSDFIFYIFTYKYMHTAHLFIVSVLFFTPLPNRIVHMWCIDHGALVQLPLFVRKLKLPSN